MDTQLRAWTIHLVAPTRFLTMNDRRPGKVKNGDVRQWRDAVVTACRRARLPKDVARRVRIDITYRFAGPPPVRDFHNINATSKACADGLTPHRIVQTKTGPQIHIGYGLIPGDTNRRVDGPYNHLGDPLPAKPYGPRGEVTMTITELETR